VQAESTPAAVISIQLLSILSSVFFAFCLLPTAYSLLPAAFAFAFAFCLCLLPLPTACCLLPLPFAFAFCLLPFAFAFAFAYCLLPAAFPQGPQILTR